MCELDLEGGREITPRKGDRGHLCLRSSTPHPLSMVDGFKWGRLGKRVCWVTADSAGGRLFGGDGEDVMG